MPIVIGTIALAAATRPRIVRAGSPWLNGALSFALLVSVVQLVPLPQSARIAVSPGLAAAEARLHLNAVDWSSRAHPLSLDPASTLWAAIVAATFALLFWSACAILESGGVRRIAHAVAIFGLIAAVLSVLQHATSPHLFYWMWAPVNSNASPYTPFGNRNYLASWLVMAIPLTFGYLMARLESMRAERGAISSTMLDDKGVWLAGSTCAMTAALLASLSRSGTIAGAAAALAFVTLSRRRLAWRGRGWLIVSLAILVTVAATYANLDALWSRMTDAVAGAGVGGRREIWTVTLTIIRDFWPAGVGVGAYERAMSLYQPPHLFSFNHAHNEYLQILTEGGVLLAVPVLVAVAAGVIRVRQCLTDDRTAMFWVRAGAASGLFAIGVQSVWDIGLHTPANAVLFVVCAAVAITPYGAK